MPEGDVIRTSSGVRSICCHCVSIMCLCIWYWVSSVLGVFGAYELFGGVSIVDGSCSASSLLHILSLVVFCTAANVAAGAGGVGTLKSVKEKAVAPSSVYVANGFAF